MIEEKNISLSPMEEENEPDSLELEVAYARLKRIGKEKFQVDQKQNDNILAKVKDSSHYFNLNLPPELNEYFIYLKDAPLYWIMDSPIIAFIEENSKPGEKEIVKMEAEPNKLLKDYYSKWVTTTRKSEKKYFAHSLLKTITKEKDKNILSAIYGGVLFSFEETLKNQETSLNYYEQAEMLARGIQGDEVQKTEICYILKVFSAFEYLNSGNAIKAGEKLQEAIVLKSDGATARFYLGLAEVLLGNRSAAFDLLCDIYEYDLSRIAYAISINNIQLFQFFLKNTVFEYTFQYPQFGLICNQLEDYLQVKELDVQTYLSKLRQKFEVFRELHLNEYQEVNVRNNFNFIEKILKNFFTCQLNIFLASVPILWGKFNETLQLVFSTIRQRFMAEIQAQLKIYDNNINDLNGLIEHLVKEIEDFKLRYKEKTKAMVQLYEQNFKEQIAVMEKKLANLAEEKKKNPGSAFKSSLSYTLVLSALVMLITGFAGYSSSYSEELSGFSQIMKAILFSGGKWGIVTFILGFFISIASSIYATYEKSSEKQRIIREIGNIKYAHEKNIESIKAETERNEKITIRNLNDRITQHKKRIAEIVEERKKREKDLNEQIEVKIEEEAAKLIGLIQNS